MNPSIISEEVLQLIIDICVRNFSSTSSTNLNETLNDTIKYENVFYAFFNLSKKISNPLTLYETFIIKNLLHFLQFDVNIGKNIEEVHLENETFCPYDDPVDIEQVKNFSIAPFFAQFCNNNTHSKDDEASSIVSSIDELFKIQIVNNFKIKITRPNIIENPHLVPGLNTIYDIVSNLIYNPNEEFVVCVVKLAQKETTFEVVFERI